MRAGIEPPLDDCAAILRIFAPVKRESRKPGPKARAADPETAERECARRMAILMDMQHQLDSEPPPTETEAISRTSSRFHASTSKVYRIWKSGKDDALLYAGWFLAGDWWPDSSLDEKLAEVTRRLREWQSIFPRTGKPTGRYVARRAPLEDLQRLARPGNDDAIETR